MRPYHQIPIFECGEPLVAIPLELFAVESPHPYEKLGANYGDRSPYYLRQSVVENLIAAQNYLELLHPQWRIQIFDAYRPIAVQQFMVDYSFAQAVQERGLTGVELSPNQSQEIWQAVYEIWAVPSFDEKTPPPHSTGAAVDVTLVDDSGEIVNMGSPIDEMSGRSLPDYYANSEHPEAEKYHTRRQLLRDVMLKAGFQRNPKEWWHFSYGDQMWAWLNNQSNPVNRVTARYGRLV
ncbi:D-alanyl-D-alanine dipeptidase [Nostoc linckia z18]|uniref:D-alanyl-D-alanine dipeptidase n=2 Tax=Nostoc linckia TaxID=92942 RepID=A0A9Q6EIJ8_NOSLI|nr:M15 family metallopeptidase [Nostoc linckia]PHK30221.1 D-alanyl-D-alanine dipeptidase [Nostoc linckia z15]PHK41520.1 D-alanyl-D-alanine dipeptidase [Nostoc linckia z16]PHJ59470.1 D-alanyl-D-alanine dipeptidase [Nostoc linckia z1]PHJ62671.1 D-alanyl-D-alanine dipeptidase [Nostoc linckia z3]PHJ68823.1 D-alanyl-D-alanine dipeptidase [Nostoc linckia z2]